MSNLVNPYPILFIVFNRPDLTQQVFASIREAQPKQLFVAADGPRLDYPDDEELCARTRNIVAQVDWDCEVYTLFRETNLGCRLAVSSAIDWFFDNVEAGIILEDDCLPSPSFFSFCNSLLDVYWFDDRIMAIGGTNILSPWKQQEMDYLFSHQGSIWGWATWKRAWSRYSLNIATWNSVEAKQTIREVSLQERFYQKRADIFDRTALNEINTWDYQWIFWRLYHRGLTILPSVNLVANIGFGLEATHTKNTDSFLARLPTQNLSTPIRIRQDVGLDVDFEEQFLEKLFFSNSYSLERSFLQRLRAKFLGMLT